LLEDWAGRALYCPACGGDKLNRYPNNQKVADLFCRTCGSDYELKSSAVRFGRLVPDGAYNAMLDRLSSQHNPHLLLLHYDRDSWRVVELLVIPKYFFIPAMIIARTPLSAMARRAGWIGCKIDIGRVPSSGKIALIEEAAPVPRTGVLAAWQRVRFLRGQSDIGARGWLLNTMRLVERMAGSTFSLDDIYRYEAEIAAIYPRNRNIRPKLRQQLQVLRDQGYLAFLGKGAYRRL
jgi:type II restriction enzyme